MGDCLMKEFAEPKRKDAVRNRAKLLAAAEIVFARDGLDATLDDVAREAGVGVGTAYRHFRNKQELASEVLAAAIEQLAIDAEKALAIPDPWNSLVDFLTTTVARQTQNRGLHTYLLQGGSANDQTHTRLWRAVSDLTTRAVSAGVLRADFIPTDLGVLLVMLRPVINMSLEVRNDLWRRYLAIMLDGMRAHEHQSQLARPLPYHDFERAMNAAFPSSGRSNRKDA